MSFYKISSITVSLFLMIMFTSGCNNSNNVINPVSGFGQASFRITAEPGSPFTKIADSAVVTISASDMSTIVKQLTITDTTVTGTVINIPAGNSRLFKVDVFDSVPKIQYTGSTTADVIAGGTVNVSIILRRVTGNVTINGIIVDNDTLLKIGLVAYYPFNGNANDESGNGNNGTIFGTTLTEDRFGKSNSAYSFNGLNQYINGGNDSSLNITQRITVQAWIYPIAITSESEGIICFFETPSQKGYGIGLNQNNIGAYACFKGDSNSGVLSSLLTLNKWTHIVGVYDGNSLNIYINASLQSKIPYTSGIHPQISQSSLTIGKWYGNYSGYYFKGNIDDIRIYNRALSQTEIYLLYHEGGWTGN